MAGAVLDARVITASAAHQDLVNGAVGHDVGLGEIRAVREVDVGRPVGVVGLGVGVVLRDAAVGARDALCVIDVAAAHEPAGLSGDAGHGFVKRHLLLLAHGRCQPVRLFFFLRHDARTPNGHLSVVDMNVAL